MRLVLCWPAGGWDKGLKGLEVFCCIYGRVGVHGGGWGRAWGVPGCVYMQVGGWLRVEGMQWMFEERGMEGGETGGWAWRRGSLDRCHQAQRPRGQKDADEEPG